MYVRTHRERYIIQIVPSISASYLVVVHLRYYVQFVPEISAYRQFTCSAGPPKSCQYFRHSRVQLMDDHFPSLFGLLIAWFCISSSPVRIDCPATGGNFPHYRRTRMYEYFCCYVNVLISPATRINFDVSSGREVQRERDRGEVRNFICFACWVWRNL